MSERPSSGDGPGSDRSTRASVDVDRVRSVLEDHPVRLAVLFGSQVAGTADPASDVDIAVEFDQSVDDRGQALLAVLTDLSVALDRNDVDLAVVDDLEPRVGRVAFADGKLLCGSAERARQHRERFETEAESDQSDRSLRERFDETLASVDRLVESGD
jgi:predicted nucleotidyltransferase